MINGNHMNKKIEKFPELDNKLAILQREILITEKALSPLKMEVEEIKLQESRT